MAEPITIVCWKWEGWRPSYYTKDHVHALARMLNKHVNIHYRLICITDKPEGITECETYPIWEDKNDFKLEPRDFNCFRRLRLFSGEMAKELGPKLLSIDLDTVILSDITDIVADTADFKIAEGFAAKYNGSLWTVRPGTHQHIWDSLTEAAPQQLREHNKRCHTKKYGSDQAWISMHIPDAPTWKTTDGLYAFSQIKQNKHAPVPNNARIVYFAGIVKPWNGSCKFETPGLHGAYMRYYDGKAS